MESLVDAELGRAPFNLAILTVDTVNRTVTARRLWIERTAHFRDRFGCHLLASNGTPALPVDLALPPVPPAPEGVWPLTEVLDQTAVQAALQGIDKAQLDVAVARAFIDPSPETPLHTRAVVVVRKGQVIAEQYAEGYGPSRPHAGWSMSKSLLGTLIGMRIGQGKLSLNDTRLLPEWNVTADDPRSAITLEHMLHMTDALDFAEAYSSYRFEDVVRMLFIEDSTAAFAALQPSLDAAGSRFSYSSGTSNLLSHILRRSFQAELGPTEGDRAYWKFPHEALFGPLGLHTAVFETDPVGNYIGSSFSHMSPRDWARFGLLYLQNGTWQGQQILPEWWVDYATRPSAASLATNESYGAHWWLNAPAVPGNPTTQRYPHLPSDLYMARGFEHQFVIVVPSRDLVIVRLGYCANQAWWTDEAGWIQAVVDAASS